MSLNLETKDTYHIFDSVGMLIVKDDPDSWKDSIGRTVLAWIAYGMPWQLGNAISGCLWRNLNISEKWNLKRHPNHTEKASRDHWSYYIIFEQLREINNPVFLPNIPRMRGMSLWMLSLTGNKLAERLYYVIYIPLARLGNVWLRICRWVGRIRSERENEWWIERHLFDVYNPSLNAQENQERMITNGWEIQKFRTKWQKRWANIIFKTIPCYPLHNRGWQLYVMPKSQSKAKLKRILLQRVGKSNLMLRLLFGDTTVTQEEINNYPHMTGYRPGVYLDETCRRDIRELTSQEAEFNAYEKDLLIWLYNESKTKI